MFDRRNTNIILAAIFCLLVNISSFAQTSEFTFQGKLTDQNAPANGVYDLSFKLYDSASLQVGSTVARDDVQVSNGVFTVTLDFGASAFDGSPRLIEISVRPGSSTGTYTALTPKQSISSTPYAVKSLKAGTADIATNATQLGGAAASQFVQTNDTRMTDARNPLPGSASYIQNATSQQAASNFNISGNGIVGGYLYAGELGAESMFRLTGLRILSTNPFRDSVFVGMNSGYQGRGNTIMGWNSGTPVTGASNSLYGGASGERLTTGYENSIFGYQAGLRLTTGKGNSFFGTRTGAGTNAGPITGNENSVFGFQAGLNLTTGWSNTLLGHDADVSDGAVSFSTAIGYGAVVSQNHSVSIGQTIAKVGIGVSAPQHKLQVLDASNTGLRVQTNTQGGTVASFGGFGDFRVDAPGIPAGRFVVKENGFVGIGATQPAKPLEVLGDIRASSFTPGAYPRFSLFYPHPQLEMRKWQIYTDGQNLNFSALNNDETAEGIWMQVTRSSGTAINRVVFPNSVVGLDVLGTGGSTSLCLNAVRQIASCSSSVRYKYDTDNYAGGLGVIGRLRPVSFKWKADDKLDLGLVAEEVAQIDPLLASYDDKGQVEGVKYDRVGVVLVNAVKEQQKQIEAQAATIAHQQQQIDALMKLVCAGNPSAEVCKAGGTKP